MASTSAQRVLALGAAAKNDQLQLCTSRGLTKEHVLIVLMGTYRSQKGEIGRGGGLPSEEASVRHQDCGGGAWDNASSRIGLGGGGKKGAL